MMERIKKIIVVKVSATVVTISAVWMLLKWAFFFML